MQRTSPFPPRSADAPSASSATGEALAPETATEHAFASEPATLDDDAATLGFALAVARIGVFEFDVRTGRQRFSSTCRELWGLAPDEAPTVERLLARIHPDDRERGDSVLRGCQRADAPDEFQVEHRIVRPDGAVRWLSVRGRTTFADTAGGRIPVQCRGTMEDVTERRLSDERYESAVRRLRESEERFRTIFEQTNDYVFTADLQQRVTSCNPAVAAALGLQPREIVGRSIAEFLVPEQFERTTAMLAQKLQESGTTRYEVEVGRGPGGTCTWEVNSTLTFGADGAPTGLHAIARDVTEQRRVRSQLERSEARLQIALESARAGVSDWDVDTGHVEWTAGCYALLGLEPGVVPPSRELWRRHVHPDDLPRVDMALADAISRVTTFAVDYRVVGADGVERWIQDRARVLRGPGGTTRILGARIDVTERKRANDRLREADRRKDEFLATLAHELRNPLAPIRTAAQLLATPGLSAAQLESVARIVQRQVGHMAYLLDDLLDVARITRGKLEIRPSEVALDTVVDAAIEAARPLIDAKRHALVVELPEPAPVVRADSQRLAQVLSNLLTNAAKYTDAGGHLALRASIVGDELRIGVRDDGIGLTPAARASIFEMFSQVQDSRNRSAGGLGIGLALVKGLVSLHGGRVEAHSDGPGRGSEFVVVLPMRSRVENAAPGDAKTTRAPEAATDVATTKRRHDGGVAATAADSTVALADSPVGAGFLPRTASAGRKRRVLVADDNRDAAESLAMLLCLHGHDVSVVHGGEAALRVAREFRPEFAVLDIGMPDLDGYAVAIHLRREDWARDVRLIALTGWGQHADQWDAHLAGFDHHFTKPADVDRLLALLDAGEERP